MVGQKRAISVISTLIATQQDLINTAVNHPIVMMMIMIMTMNMMIDDDDYDDDDDDDDRHNCDDLQLTTRPHWHFTELVVLFKGNVKQRKMYWINC